ncbi:DEAD/DEAH box helicase [Aquibacillus kalidii]|uniref:DEAD/DEAH box helicase n=1 Tax=Aquibacillus kalidii TaxID=2762597 RepID=UPI001F171102|nr:SNF2 helicase associated domain-containing protein [Aquibacillus kalidii]
MIKEKCGSVSYKSGEAFYRANKVTLTNVTEDYCGATVKAKENFKVSIEKKANGQIITTCSCPTLASFSKDCQHIAAVLFALHDYNRQALLPHQTYKQEKLSNQLLSIFQDSPSRGTEHQNYFENRQVLDPLFTCTPIDVVDKGTVMAISMRIGTVYIQNIRVFLQRIKDGATCQLSESFLFDINKHCFNPIVDGIVEQLIAVMSDDSNGKDKIIPPDFLPIPASSWERLLPLLVKAPNLIVDYEGKTFVGLTLSDDQSLPLHFSFLESEHYNLIITGLEQMVLFSSYHTVMYDGKIQRLDQHDFKRLAELQRMLNGTKTNRIPIPSDQIDFFIDKVVPGLKRLGKVQLSDKLENKLEKTPLIAKLFLDRVSNRLLAGLEFHYGHLVINPVEENESSINRLIVRDRNKEEEILQLMEESLFTKTESGYFLHNDELEYDFLTYIVPKLQKLTNIYTTTAIRNRVVKDNVFPKIRVKVKRERTNWLEFKFEMDGIPDDDIRELLYSMEEKRKYYRLRNGSLLSLETKEFQEINRFLHGIPDEYGDLATGLNLPLEHSLKLLDTVEISNTFLTEQSFKSFVEEIKNPSSMDYKLPETLVPTLRDYQIQGYRWMKTLANYGFGGILADDMGLGKTLQSITFILSELSNIRANKLPVLVVCPSSVTYNWLSELMKFAPDIETIVMDGTKQTRTRLQKETTNLDVLITSYPILRQDIHWYDKQQFHTAIFDEAQAFKNPITQTFRAVKRVNANNYFALTGTPVENSIEELWAIFHVVFPELFLGLKEYSTLSRKEISRRSKPFMLRRMKKDVLGELPEKLESLESVELLSDQKKLYAAYLSKLRHDTLKHLDKDTFRKNKIRILAGLTRLRQICCHPGLFVDGYKGSSAKFELLLRIITEAKFSNRRVLIFSQFTKMLEIIGRELAKLELDFFYLDGQTPSEDRVEICNQFNEGERNYMLISMKAGGTGLNLTGADTVIFYDSWWNPAVEEQAADRAYRIGQKNNVQVIKLIARGTIEEKMTELQEKKRHLIQEVIDSDGEIATSLTEEDIREILLLNAE